MTHIIYKQKHGAATAKEFQEAAYLLIKIGYTVTIVNKETTVNGKKIPPHIIYSDDSLEVDYG